MSVFNQTNNNSNSVVELENKKGDNMELVDVNVVVECGNPQYAIGSDKIIGYEEIEVCGECGAIISDKTHKYCTQCGTKVREVKTSQNTFKSDKIKELNLILLKIECDEEFNKYLNHIEYCSICKKEKKENLIIDYSMIVDVYDCYGREETEIEFEDEIQAEIEGDWYCRASGGGFSSEADYWNYILG